MNKVGIRELKENLSKYLKRSKATGEKIIVTDRKKEVAVIVPICSAGMEEKLLEMKNRGLLEWTGKKPVGPASRIPTRGKDVSDAVLDDREEP
jgi:prevent-host-death family protein